jgi:hypothetical protein
MAGNDEDQGRGGRLSAEDRGWSSTSRVLDGRTIERSSDAIFILHRAQGDEERMFLGLASKPRSAVSPSLASKLVAPILMGLASKPLAQVSRFGPQNWQL